MRTGEARDGIFRIIDHPQAPRSLRPYFDLVRSLNAPDAPIARYPGSPWIARKLSRAQDRLLLCETHPEIVHELRRATAGDKRVTVRSSDGWAVLKSDLPPPERRAVVLIDPPFEATDEFARLARGLRHAYRRLATGVFVAWYPIKTRGPVDELHAAVTAAGLRRVTIAELLVRAEALESDESPRLAGCGLMIVNPPWTLVETLAELLPWLGEVLAQGPGAGARLETLVGE